jgi:hypothetical protein
VQTSPNFLHASVHEVPRPPAYQPPDVAPAVVVVFVELEDPAFAFVKRFAFAKPIATTFTF